MVVVAFAVPLGLVVKEMARDRAFSNAERVAAAIAPALSITTDRNKLERVVASAGSDTDIAVVEVYVPEAEMSNGVGTAWAVLTAVGIALIVGSVAVADRLGVRMVRPAQRLVEGAHELGEGKLGARVPEDGPTELRLAAAAFNSMADQVVQLLANERELAADLSHRLRTPLTVLRLNAASLGDGTAAEQTRVAVAKLEGEVDQIIR